MRTFLLGVLLYIAGLMLCVSLLFAQQQEARMSLGVVGGGVPAGGGPSYLLEAYFEDEADGVDLDTITLVWAEDGAATDEYEIDTAVKYAGAGSAKIAMTTTSTNRVYKGFAAQTGTFTVEFYMSYDVTGTTDMDFMAIGDGEFNDGLDLAGTLVTGLQVVYNKHLKYLVHAGGYADSTADLEPDTWYRIRLHINVATQTFDLLVGDTEYVTGAAFVGLGCSAPDRFYMRAKAVGAADSVWIDNILVY